MTNNLFASVTFDSFGASIPTNNHSLWVQHEDRVVLDFVEEHPIFFFAIPQRVHRRVGCLGIHLRDMTESMFYVEGGFTSHTASLAQALYWSMFRSIPFPSGSVLVHAP